MPAPCGPASAEPANRTAQHIAVAEALPRPGKMLCMHTPPQNGMRLRGERAPAHRMANLTETHHRALDPMPKARQSRKPNTVYGRARASSWIKPQLGLQSASVSSLQPRHLPVCGYNLSFRSLAATVLRMSSVSLLKPGPTFSSRVGGLQPRWRRRWDCSGATATGQFPVPMENQERRDIRGGLHALCSLL